MAGVTIDSGPVEASQRFSDVKKTQWRALTRKKRDFLAVQLSYDCRCLVEFCAEAELVWHELGYESAADMIRNGYELDAEEIEVAVAWLKHNDPEIEVSLPEVSAAARAEQLGVPKHGGNRKSEEFQGDNVTLKRRGNDPTYTCRRLLRDHPDLFERVKSGELSANAAAVEAGFRKRQISVPVNDVACAVRRLMKYYTFDELMNAWKEWPDGR